MHKPFIVIGYLSSKKIEEILLFNMFNVFWIKGHARVFTLEKLTGMCNSKQYFLDKTY